VPDLGGRPLRVWDPGGTLIAYLQSAQVPFTPVESLEQVPAEPQVLLVGPNALTGRKVAADAWRPLTRAGARIVVLEQDAGLESKALDAKFDYGNGLIREAALAPEASWRAATVTPQLLERWAVDGAVCRKPLVRGQYLRPLIQSPAGVCAAEFSLDRGTVVLCQLLVRRFRCRATPARGACCTT